MLAAFPGAYGWGAGATGGRGGVIRVVSSLANSGAGTLRAALEASETRIITSTIAGEVDLLTPIVVTNPNFTLAMQTAPGNGIYITGERITIQTYNWVIRYLKYRGDGGVGFIALRPFSGPIYDGILDHCSTAWNSDDSIDIWHEGDISDPAMLDNEIYNITVQNCLLTEPDDGHPTLSMIRGDYNNNAKNMIHHISYLANLHTSTGYRNPRIFSQHSEVINNVVYNQGYFPMGFGDEAEVDLINNYMKPGLLAGNVKFVRDNEYGDNPMSIYLEGTVFEGVKAADDDGWPYVVNEFAPGGIPDEGTHRRLTRLSAPTYAYREVSAATALTRVLAEAGACRRITSDGTWEWTRDTLDSRIVSEVENDTGPSAYITDPSSETPPSVISGTAYTDTDGDGMPDKWEIAEGLDPADPSDGPTIGPDGYSNLERFLNGSEPEQPGGNKMQARDNGDGTYSLTLKTDMQPSKVAITGEVNKKKISQVAEVIFAPIGADPEKSEITVTPSMVPADGASVLEITVQLKDALGNPLTSGGDIVVLKTNLGTLS